MKQCYNVCMGKRLNFWYGSIFGTYWMIFAVISSFASVFLLARGYSNAQIGVTLAAANILAVVLQPLTANVADRSERIGTIEVSQIMTVMMMAFTLGMFFFGGGSMALCVTFALLIAWHTALQPMFNALTFKLEETGIPVNFGVARSVGSLTYSIVCAVLGTVVERTGILSLPITAELACLMLLIALVMTKRTFDRALVLRRKERLELDRERLARTAGADTNSQRLNGSVSGAPAREEHEAPAQEDQKPRKVQAVKSQEEAQGSQARSREDPEAERISLRDFIRRNRLFFILNIGVVGIFFSNSILNSYMMQIVDGVGGTSEDMGRILGFMAALEIPTMVVFSWLKRKFSCQLMLKVASVGFVCKIAVCWIADSVAVLFAGQLFQLVSFALFLPGMVYFTGENMSPGEAVRGQALFTTMITVTTIFSSLIGGWILDVSGPKSLTFISTIATAMGAVIILLVVDRIKPKKEKN